MSRMMDKNKFLYITLIILLAPFFLISIGMESETPAIWWIGLILLAIGAIIPPVTRFAFSGNNEKAKEEKNRKRSHE